MASSVVAASAALAPSSLVSSPLHKSSLSGSPVSGLPALRLATSSRPLKVQASGKKLNVKQPLGPSGDVKYRGGADASGSKSKGKGVYQFTKKYGANVDGYSPIFVPEEWSSNGDTYAGGTTGLAIWGATLGGVLLAGILLVYNTSALAQ